jgi:phosphatidylserine/phosphatidylglycerophosphate/cardiolipin synthase-like enzyme
LSAFFTKAKNKSLTIAMYDFTAPHVLSGLNALMNNSRKRFRLILDPGVSLEGDVKADDVHEEKVRDTLSDTAGDRFDFLWGAVKKRGKVVEGLFPTAYHIKVAVSGGQSFWLSSGNWQSSNQPDLTGFDLDDQKVLTRIQKRYNREWHVIVEHPVLASIYEKFIKRDMRQACGLQVKGDAPMGIAREMVADRAELMVSRGALEKAEHDIPKPQAFAPGNFNFTRSRPLRVQPVLTPDNYQETVLPIIKSARKTLYFQNQYIKVGKEPGDKFSALLDALLEKITAGVEVKIILRSLPNAADELEALQFYAAVNHGIENLSFIRYQAGSHTKGIIVDSKKVVIGSHNWSKQGLTENRDASLIFFSSRIARYYERVFEYDWANLAQPQVMSDDEMPVAASTIAAGAAGMGKSSPMTRAPWDFYEDLS